MPNLKFDNFRHIYSYTDTIYIFAHVLEVNVKLVADYNRVSEFQVLGAKPPPEKWENILKVSL